MSAQAAVQRHDEERTRQAETFEAMRWNLQLAVRDKDDELVAQRYVERRAHEPPC